ncbi:MAG: nucleoside deaminase [Phycisphaerales bacterium]|nr:nucleoside deaminase [Phycisphaerales bacterium]MCB9862243.1 nucleoside deaminase [Phycisphaerales bacterium]
MTTTRVDIQLPDWLRRELPELASRSYPSDDARMEVALRAASENIRHETGGPFGAAIFNKQDGSLVSVGVNLVTSSGLSMTHAEVVAIAMAQAELKTFDLGKGELAHLQLATSAEPCSMCIGAIHWSGLKSIIASARDEDVRAIGFDEGHKPADWIAHFASHGIEFTPDVLRQRGIEVLQMYARRGGHIYNAGGSGA